MASQVGKGLKEEDWLAVPGLQHGEPGRAGSREHLLEERA